MNTITPPRERRLNPSEVIAIVKQRSRHTRHGVAVRNIAADMAELYDRPHLTVNENRQLTKILDTAVEYGFLSVISSGYRPGRHS